MVAGSGSLEVVAVGVGSGSLEVVVAGSLEVVVVVLASVASVAFVAFVASVEVVGAVIPWIGLDWIGFDSLLNIITL